MSDDILVTAPRPNSGYGDGVVFTPPYPATTEQQIIRQVIMPYYSSPAFCTDYIQWMYKYIQEHNQDDPLTWEIIANNIRCVCGAEFNYMNSPEAGFYAAFHNNQNPVMYFDYVKNAQDQLTGGITTPITAWAHYLWGDGRERFVKMEDVGFRIHPNQIAPIMEIINSGASGQFFVSERFSRDTTQDGIIPASYLGHVTLKTEGKLMIETSGAWSYTGVVRGYNDMYDANPGNFRGPVAEQSTWILSRMKGTEYQIALPGEINIQGNGFR
ncbi:Colicin-M [Serratia rubidaea]|nr:Colicin-M [Serratia rubidaea]